MTQIINIYKNENNQHNNVQTMTSLEIAELTGKQHKT
jgi:phage regulator Rha-like protein